MFLKHRFWVTQESAHLWHNITCFLYLKRYKHYFSVFICESVKPTICIPKTFLRLSRHMQFETTFLSNGFCSLPNSCMLISCKDYSHWSISFLDFSMRLHFEIMFYGRNCMDFISNPYQLVMTSS